MQSIGERLKEARERTGVSLREAAEATKIRSDYLSKLEGNKFDFGLTPLYIRSFIRNYAGYLKISPAPLLADFEALGYGEPGVPRPVNREVYGKVDFGGAARTEPRTETPVGATEVAPTATKSPKSPPLRRPGKTVLRHRPALDSEDNSEALIKLGGIALGGAVLVVLLIWGLISLFSPAKPKPGTSAQHPAPADVTRPIAPDAPAIAEPVPAGKVRFKAVGGAVTVRVWEQKPDRSYGREVLLETTLRAGETKSADKSGPLYLSVSAPENLQIETATQSIKLAEQKAVLGSSKNIALP